MNTACKTERFMGLLCSQIPGNCSPTAMPE